MLVLEFLNGKPQVKKKKAPKREEPEISEMEITFERIPTEDGVILRKTMKVEREDSEDSFEES